MINTTYSDYWYFYYNYTIKNISKTMKFYKNYLFQQFNDSLSFALNQFFKIY